MNTFNAKTIEPGSVGGNRKEVPGEASVGSVTPSPGANHPRPLPTSMASPKFQGQDFNKGA